MLSTLIIRKKIIQSIEFLKNIYIKSQRSGDIDGVFASFQNTLRQCVTIIIVGYSWSCIIIASTPLILYSFDNSIVQPMVPVCLPGTSIYRSAYDYALNCLFSFLILLYGHIVQIHFDALLIIQVLHVILLSNILRQKVNCINGYTLDGQDKMAAHFEMKINVRNIVLCHNEFLR